MSWFLPISCSKKSYQKGQESTVSQGFINPISQDPPTTCFDVVDLRDIKVREDRNTVHVQEHLFQFFDKVNIPLLRHRLRLLVFLIMLGNLDQILGMRMPMTAALGPKLLRKVDQEHFPSQWTSVDTDTALPPNLDCIVLYFSAHYCPPCRQFTPQLVERSLRAKLLRKSFEIVFVSADPNHAEWQNYYKLMPWLALPYEESQKRAPQLLQQLGLRGIPSAVIYWKNGKIETQGRQLLLQPGFFSNVGPRLQMLEASKETAASSSSSNTKNNQVAAGGASSTTRVSQLGLPSASSEEESEEGSSKIPVDVVLPDSVERMYIEFDPQADDAQAAEVFLLQLYSVTEIEPSKQRIFFAFEQKQENGQETKLVQIQCEASCGHFLTTIIPQLETSAKGHCAVPRVYVLGNISDLDDPFEFRNSPPPEIEQVVEQRQAYVAAKAQGLKAGQRPRRILADAMKVRTYEDRELQTACLNQIPVPELFESAKKRVEDACGSKDFPTAFLEVLVSWFKHRFMKWPEANPPSVHCPGGKCKPAGACQSNESEQIFDAQNTELYSCLETRREQRFPRYNNVFKLLETRMGRCGEWANTFAAMLRAVGFETRYIADTTDHVWNEVWLPSKSRWVHVDPCEASIDAPLLYEQGWGKKLEYIFGYARDHCLDVSRRYTKKGVPALTRHNFASEQELRNIFAVARSFLEDEDQASLRGVPAEKRQARQALLDRRRGEEEAHLRGLHEQYNANEVDAKNLNARESGDQAWRMGRQEMGTVSIYGGKHADTKSFEDVEHEHKVQKVVLWSGQFVHGLQLVFDGVALSKHPPRWDFNDKECEKRELLLDSDEHISTVKGNAGLILDHLNITTNKGRTITAGSSGGGQPFQFKEGHIVGLLGGYGGHVHNIGVRYAKTGPEAPGAGRTTRVSSQGQSALGGSSSSSKQAAAKETQVQEQGMVCEGGVCRLVPASSSTSTTAGAASSFQPGTRASASSSSGATSSTKQVDPQAVRARIKEIFRELTEVGKMKPNEAAAEALNRASEEFRQQGS
ncbi:unnamed protein product [Amoebophrya sp. A25]|nr:unnamed protein product [Amoebophrya sp. A25]|eukprot:GSA25T00020458001.1